MVNKRDSRAQFKGSGTINGSGDYRFTIWTTDGDLNGGSPDTFRIRIWIEDQGVETVIYDNGFDQAIGGGNIPPITYCFWQWPGACPESG